MIDQARSEVGPSSSIGQYLANVSKIYRQPGTPLTFVDIDPPQSFEIEGRHGLRVSWSGIGARKNHVAGYLYIVQSATHFHQFLAITDQSYFASQKAEFDARVRRDREPRQAERARRRALAPPGLTQAHLHLAAEGSAELGYNDGS